METDFSNKEEQTITYIKLIFGARVVKKQNTNIRYRGKLLECCGGLATLFTELNFVSRKSLFEQGLCQLGILFKECE